MFYSQVISGLKFKKKKKREINWFIFLVLPGGTLHWLACSLSLKGSGQFFRSSDIHINISSSDCFSPFTNADKQKSVFACMQIMPVAIGIGPKAAISSRFLKWSIFSDRVAFLLLLLFCFLCVCWSRKLIEFLLNLILNKKDWANGKHYSTKLIKKVCLHLPVRFVQNIRGIGNRRAEAEEISIVKC